MFGFNFKVEAQRGGLEAVLVLEVLGGQHGGGGRGLAVDVPREPRGGPRTARRAVHLHPVPDLVPQAGASYNRAR